MPGTHPLQTGGEDHLATGRSIYFIERVLLLAGRDPETGRYPPSPPVVSSLSHREIFFSRSRMYKYSQGWRSRLILDRGRALAQ